MLMQISEIEDRLWRMADNLRANTHLRSSEYSLPVLGLIFLKFANEKFVKVDKEIRATLSASSRYEPSPNTYRARGAIYLRPEARFDSLLKLTDSDDRSDALNKAMDFIEKDNTDLAGSLPTNAYSRLGNTILGDLLRGFASVLIDPDMEGDPFGRIYEYFLSKFALSEGQRGGEFFTPSSVVQLIVEVIEPFNGLILDPACGSGGMFVQSAQFVKNHLSDPSTAVSIHGQEKALETVRLCKMNLAVHGLYGDIRDANSYYDDLHNSVGHFDFVMANPPF
jgi:type I restriction enzyme M protein